MSRVNLLPWRRLRRQRRQNEFLAIVGAAAVGAVLVVVRAGEYRGIHASQFDLRVPQHMVKNEPEQ
jgi:Tfp pilus assembly protein PilN